MGAGPLRRFAFAPIAKGEIMPMPTPPRAVFAALCTLAIVAPAAAQPVLSVSTSEVRSGAAVTATVTGTPGLYWALVGSTRDNGLSHGGVALSVGADVEILGTGFFDPSGTAAVAVTPPLGAGVAAYYLQAVSAGNPGFLPPTPSNGIALRPRGFYTNAPTFPAGLSAGGARVTGVATPTAPGDAASKAYVDATVTGGFGTAPVFAAGLGVNNARITNVGAPTAPSDAATKNYVDTSAVLIGPAAKQTRLTAGALIDLEQVGSGDLLSLRVNSNTIPGGSGLQINHQVARVLPDSGFVLRGILGVGVIPATGAGERLMWHPYKGAFRAGSIGTGGTQWDDDNVGFYSWAGGYNTLAPGLGSLAMGYQSQALGSYATALGYSALADGTGAVSIGYRSTVCHDFGVAIGQRASTADAPTLSEPCGGTARTGAIVLADASTTSYVGPTANNQFVVRSAGGVRFYSNATLTTGVGLNAGGSSWNVISDRNAKYGFEAVDEQDILRRLITLPLSSYFYKDGDGRRYIGPMAQDFKATFGLGDDDTRIAMNDIDAVSLASLKALAAQVQTLRDDNGRLARENAAAAAGNAALRAAVDELLGRVAALEAAKR